MKTNTLRIDFNTHRQTRMQSNWRRELDVINFLEFSYNYITSYRSMKNKADTYRNTLDNFRQFEEFNGRKYLTNEINCDTLYDFLDFLTVEKRLRINTTTGIIQRVKRMLDKAYQEGWNVNHSYTDMKPKTEYPFAVALTKKDIAQLYFFKELTRSQEEIKDLFVFQCQTGFRYSDVSKLTPEHFRDNIIVKKTQKTRSTVYVPQNVYTKEIYRKYGCNIPKPRSIQQYNAAIKEVCKLAGLTRKISYEVELAGNIEMITKPLYQLVSSHTARRTFVTQCMKDNWTIGDIQSCTGHKTLTCLMRYNRQDKERIAHKLAATYN